MTTDKLGSPSPNETGLEWTGERCVPWVDDTQVLYEHYHRYALAMEFVAGKRVLDLASGEGYGCALLAKTAAEVVGVDIDPISIEHAQTAYKNLTNINFTVGSITDRDLLSDADTFDVITCFEAIELVAEQDAMLAMVRNRLAPGGLFIVSTPDVDVYQHEHHRDNPFHVKELTEQELTDLLQGSFEYLAIYRQNVAVGSVIVAKADPARPSQGVGHVGQILTQGDGWEVSPGLPHMYLLAFASDAPLEGLPAAATMLDPDMTLLRRIHRLYEDSRREVAELKQTVTDVDKLRSDAFDDAAALQSKLIQSERQRLQAEAQRDELRSGRVFRALTAYRQGLDRVMPEGSRRRSAYHRALQSSPPLAVPTSTNPEVSVVIPVHGHWEVTRRCLQSIADHPPAAAFEVIVVDDASPDTTGARLEGVLGIEVVSLQENVGFLRACNAGFKACRGAFTMLLNNDTEVTEGWLDELLAVAREPGVGAVGSRLVYPDGRLQEAGGVIFSDGDGWNVGRGLSADDPGFGFRRSVDYCSGAALLVRSDVLADIGGFDDRFAPAYYEDTDLQFEIRARGLDVVYQPRSTIIHDEGVSHGTDITSGTKTFQAINRRKFVEKWSAVLPGQPSHTEQLPASVFWQHKIGVVVIIDHYVPRTDEDSGSRRMFGIIENLIGMGYGVIFVPDDRRRHEPYVSELQDLGVEVLYGGFDLAESLAEISELIRLVIVSRPSVAWRYMSMLRNTVPDCPIAYDTVDLHYLRERRRAEIAGTTPLAADATRELELSLMRASDLTLVVSPVEKQILSAEIPDARIEILPNVHPRMVEHATPDGRSGLLFVGSMVHDPNEDGIIWFVDRILPLLHERRPGVHVKVVGRQPTPRVQALAGASIEIVGWVQDLAAQYATTRVVIAPLRYGAGIKGKIGESLAYGVPVVSTSIGVEGMGLRDRETALVADNELAFAEKVLELLDDDVLWSELSAAGLAHVDERFGQSATRAALHRLLDVNGRVARP